MTMKLSELLLVRKDTTKELSRLQNYVRPALFLKGKIEQCKIEQCKGGFENEFNSKIEQWCSARVVKE